MNTFNNLYTKRKIIYNNALKLIYPYQNNLRVQTTTYASAH